MSKKAFVIMSIVFGILMIIFGGVLGFIGCDPNTVNHEGYSMLGFIIGAIGLMSVVIGPTLPMMWED